MNVEDAIVAEGTLRRITARERCAEKCMWAMCTLCVSDVPVMVTAGPVETASVPPVKRNPTISKRVGDVTTKHVAYETT